VASANLCGSMTWAEKKIPGSRIFVLPCRVPRHFLVAGFDNICSIIAFRDAAAVLDLRAQEKLRRNSRRLDLESDAGKPS
jgi:hypothetical protein